MSEIKTAAQLVAACKDAAAHKTLYIMGCFGAPMTAANKKRYTANHSYNKQAARTAKINAATEDTFGFDCVCLIKGLLWGWSGDKSKTYGGAGYACNGVPDIGADQMIKACEDVTTDFSTIISGEAVWMEGHIGVYIGDGLAVECTPRWEDCVQITAVHNIGTKDDYNGRKWTKHGKLPYVSYADSTEDPAPVITGHISTGTDEDNKEIFDALVAGGLTPAGAAGLMGNFMAESAMKSENLQNTGNTKLDMTDAEYTSYVDNGTYTNFAKDGHGYGLAQWTYWTRKRDLLAFAKETGKSIGDSMMQVAFTLKELKSYTAVLKVLQTTTSVKEASDIVLTQFERPADMSDAVKAKRAAYGQTFYNKFYISRANKTVDEMAQEVLAGKWGNGADRKKQLTNAGYDYDTIQARVNELVAQKNRKTVDELAREVIADKWGNGQERKDKLTAEGYDYAAVQKRVNELLA